MLNSGRSGSWSGSPAPRGGQLAYDRSSARRQGLEDFVTFKQSTRTTMLKHPTTIAGGGCVEPPSLASLCLRSLESSLGKGLVTLSLQGLPLGLAENIYQYVVDLGSRMAQMEVSRALAPLLSKTVTSLDFTAAAADQVISAAEPHSGGSSGGFSPGNGIVGDSALLELANGVGAGLVSLDLSGCRLVTNAGVLGVTERCPQIASLGISGCDRVTDEAIYLVPHRIPGLTELNLTGLSGVSASGIAYLSFLPSLERLSLARCCQIGDEALTALGRGNCRDSLRWLDLSGTAITDSTASTSLRSINLLEYLSLSGTSISLSIVNSISRDLCLSATLPDAPKTRASCNRTLLLGSRWSKRQSGYAPRGSAAHTRQNAASFRYGRGTSMRGWEGGPSKMLRVGGGGGGLEGGGRRRGVGATAIGQVKIGFGSAGEEARAETVEDSGRELMMELVRGIVRLWPAVPSR